MTDVRPNRRQLLKGAGVLGATAALLSPTAAIAEQNNAAQGLEGSWLTTVTPTAPGSLPFKVLVTFDTGGGLVETEQGDQAPPILASPGHGAWVSSGSDHFAFNFFKLLYDTSRNFAGLVRNHGTSQLEGDTLTGSGRFVVIDPTGKVISTGTYTFDATRIRVEGH